jgi:hypothetical protein
MTDKQKANKNMTIVAINMALLIAYTLLIRIYGGGGEGVIFLAFIIAMHFALCLLLAIIPNLGKGFLLSALAVLLIGFSTCYVAYTIH